MKIGKEVEIVEVEPNLVPFEGEEIDTSPAPEPEREVERERETVPEKERVKENA